MPTPHLEAEDGDFAPLVLMPGDPRRARFIAETMLDQPRLVNQVRGVEGYTGKVGGRPVSVLASGMGCPSMTIYATELFTQYGVRRIVRVGTCGAYADDLQLGDVVVATAAHTDSAINDARIPGVRFAPVASFPLVRAAVEHAESKGLAVQVGPVFSAEHFYLKQPGVIEGLRDHGALGVDMESAALFAVAAATGRQALTVLTVSDHLFRKERMSSEERETRFVEAASLAIAAGLHD